MTRGSVIKVFVFVLLYFLTWKKIIFIHKNGSLHNPLNLLKKKKKKKKLSKANFNGVDHVRGNGKYFNFDPLDIFLDSISFLMQKKKKKICRGYL